MSALTLQLTPGHAQLGLLAEPQLAYLLLTIATDRDAGDAARPVNWAIVADASKSMRIPIVDDRQFRDLVRSGGAQETLVDGVPVWQLTAPLPPEMRAATSSALDHVARALHTVVEQLGGQDRFALIACAETATILTSGAAGAGRADLARGVEQLRRLNLGDETDLALGLELGLDALRGGRDGRRVERLLLLTDGFTRRSEVCMALASTAAAERIAISTLGLGGEFQEDVLTGLADRSGGRALFLPHPEEIPRAVAAELEAARSVAARGLTLSVALESGVALRRVTRIRPTLAVLHEAAPGAGGDLPLGDLEAGAQLTLLIELLAPPLPPGPATLGALRVSAAGGRVAERVVRASYGGEAPALPPEVSDAAARSSAARLQRRASLAAASGQPQEAERLLLAAAARLDELGEAALARLAREQAAALRSTGRTDRLATKELTYATRRLGSSEQ